MTWSQDGRQLYVIRSYAHDPIDPSPISFFEGGHADRRVRVTSSSTDVIDLIAGTATSHENLETWPQASGESARVQFVRSGTRIKGLQVTLESGTVLPVVDPSLWMLQSSPSAAPWTVPPCQHFREVRTYSGSEPIYVEEPSCTVDPTGTYLVEKRGQEYLLVNLETGRGQYLQSQARAGEGMSFGR